MHVKSTLAVLKLLRKSDIAVSIQEMKVR